MRQHIVAIGVMVVIGIGAGFYGGTQYEKSSLASAGLLRNAAMNGGNGGNGAAGQGRRPGGGAGAGQNGGGFTAGDITAQDDKSLTVKGRDGSFKIVYFSASTTVGKSVAGALSDLAVGESVMVNGTTSPDGSVAAESIQIRPASGR